MLHTEKWGWCSNTTCAGLLDRPLLYAVMDTLASLAALNCVWYAPVFKLLAFTASTACVEGMGSNARIVALPLHCLAAKRENMPMFAPASTTVAPGTNRILSSWLYALSLPKISVYKNSVSPFCQCWISMPLGSVNLEPPLGGGFDSSFTMSATMPATVAATTPPATKPIVTMDDITRLSEFQD